MGAWGAASFDNDDALDWVAVLEAAGDDSVLEAAFDAVLGAGDDSDLLVEGPAIAAAEVVAAALGAPAPDLPESVAVWASGEAGTTVRASTCGKAIRAVQQIAEHSEMLGLWSESNDYASWQAVIADLQKRLAGATP